MNLYVVSKRSFVVKLEQFSTYVTCYGSLVLVDVLYVGFQVFGIFWGTLGTKLAQLPRSHSVCPFMVLEGYLSIKLFSTLVTFIFCYTTVGVHVSFQILRVLAPAVTLVAIFFGTSPLVSIRVPLLVLRHLIQAGQRNFAKSAFLLRFFSSQEIGCVAQMPWQMRKYAPFAFFLLCVNLQIFLFHFF